MCDHFIECMKRGDLRSVEEYINSLRSVNEYVYKDDENQLNVLHLAVGLGSDFREEIVEFLVSRKADLNYPGKSDDTDDIRPLHLASMWGYDMTVKLLLYHGADASLRDSNDLSPVDYASIFDNYYCISILLKYGSLNSTTLAWSAIMDSSLGDNHSDSLSDGRQPTVLDSGGDNHDRSTFKPEANLFDVVEEEKEEEEDYDPLAAVPAEDVDLQMDSYKLRSELKRHGFNPGPITNTTKSVYAKLLAHLARADKELVCSPKTKTRSQSNGYSIQLNCIITGKFATKQALDLEKEFISLSGSKDYHGPKQFFNYILIDPRITKNLPEQALEASDSDTSGNLSSQSPDGLNNPKHAMRKVNRRFNSKLFTIFVGSIFYIGKGQKKRDLMHLYDALADRGSITHKKIERIRSIWNDGYGVVSLHLFHNITSKEALTREALMIETVGLGNLTNLLKGTVQFKLGWNDHKRKLLGALLLHRAYNQLLNEGERQLKRDDLKLANS